MKEDSFRLKSSLQKIAIRGLMFLIYIFIGSGMFMLLEKKNAEEIKIISDRWLKMQRDFERKLSSTNNSIANISKDIKLFVEEITESVEKGYYKDYRYYEWRFVDSFFFCANVITTIGYGHITPTSDAGRVVMMLYALFGIPLTGFFLRTVGNEVTSVIGFLVKLYERRMFNREVERLEMKCALIACCLALVMLFIGALAFTLNEAKWNFIEGFYFCFVTLTTIGFGDFVPNQDKDVTQVYLLLIELASLVYYVLGLSIMSTVIVSISSVIEEKTRKLDVRDPMEAVRNLRIENLNSKAMKKLGYKVDEGFNPSGRNGVSNTARGSIVPDDSFHAFHEKRIAASSSASIKRNVFINEGYDGNDNVVKQAKKSESIIEIEEETIDNLQESEEKNDKEISHNEDETKNHSIINNEDQENREGLNHYVNNINVASTLNSNSSNNTKNKNNSNDTKRNYNLLTKCNKNQDEKNSDINETTQINNKHSRNNNANLKRKILSKELRKYSATFKHVGLPSELFASSYSRGRETKPIIRRASSCELDMKHYTDDDDNNKPMKLPLTFTRSISLDGGTYSITSRDALFPKSSESST